MFQDLQGLTLAGGRLVLDSRRAARRGFVSHAHADHFAPHQQIYCTPATAVLLAQRFDVPTERFHHLPLGQTLEWDALRLTAYPAGHMLGSAMLLADDGNQRVLYTGDFRLGQSSTAEPAELVPADVLIMECTFGRPEYRFPSRSETAQRLLECVRSALDCGETPVIEAYAAGKAQEVIRILTSGGVRCLVAPDIYQVCQAYRQLGCELGAYAQYGRSPLDGAAIIRPPGKRAASCLPLPRRRRDIAVTGWARRPWPGRYCLPLSDHADYDELIDCVERVQPRVVYCCHGQRTFVDDLRRRGWDARWLQHAS